MSLFQATCVLCLFPQSQKKLYNVVEVIEDVHILFSCVYILYLVIFQGNNFVPLFSPSELGIQREYLNEQRVVFSSPSFHVFLIYLQKPFVLYKRERDDVSKVPAKPVLF